MNEVITVKLNANEIEILLQAIDFAPVKGIDSMGRVLTLAQKLIASQQELKKELVDANSISDIPNPSE